jgi:hypothetical protein
LPGVPRPEYRWGGTPGTAIETPRAATVLPGRYHEARQHYQEAIRVTTEMRFRPELAVTQLQLAELLLEHYPDEKNEAIDHLDFARKEFPEMKMQPSLERASRQKEDTEGLKIRQESAFNILPE